MKQNAIPTVSIPTLLLPKAGYDYTKWSVIACDQFTSQRDYWEQLDAFCGEISTLRLVFPEYYLAGADDEAIENRIRAIHDTMQRYIEQGIFDAIHDFVLVERALPTGGVRIGLVVAIDLDCYDYHPLARAAIRATEATVEERLPIRVRIRDGAALELSHAMMLVDDARDGIIERLYAGRHRFPLLYDVPLSMGGGHVRGWRVTSSADVQAQLENLVQGRAFQYAVGDGNHSIASAKVYWERLRAGLSPQEAQCHPARFCTCELINLNSDGLTFHPIHRAVWGVDAPAFVAELRAYMQAASAKVGQCDLRVIAAGQAMRIPCHGSGTDVIEQVSTFLVDYCRRLPQTKVDYIHGEAHLEHVIETVGGLGILMPSMAKSELFPYVEAHGILPKKAFSLGEAEEKRYYMECKRIR